MARVITAPEPLILTGVPVFLGGSIEMGAAEDWQARIVDGLADVSQVTLLNPRRADFDPSWPQDANFAPFAEQVNWEQDGLAMATMIVMYLAPGTISPISLLEFGQFLLSGKLLVCCPEGFQRKGNIDVMCRRFGVEQVPDLDAVIARIRAFGGW